MLVDLQTLPTGRIGQCKYALTSPEVLSGYELPWDGRGHIRSDRPRRDLRVQGLISGGPPYPARPWSLGHSRTCAEHEGAPPTL